LVNHISVNSFHNDPLISFCAPGDLLPGQKGELRKTRCACKKLEISIARVGAGTVSESPQGFPRKRCAEGAAEGKAAGTIGNCHLAG